MVIAVWLKASCMTQKVKAEYKKAEFQRLFNFLFTFEMKLVQWLSLVIDRFVWI